MSKILAKSHDKGQEEITLLRHTLDVLEVFENIKEKIKGDNKDKLMEATKIAIFLHDLGKVLPSFQIKSLGNIDYEPWDVIYEIPHSLFSVFWIDKNKLKEKLGEDYFNFVISAISYHHWRENFDDLISRDNEIFIKLCQKVISEWGEILKNNLQQEFTSCNDLKDLIDINKTWLESIVNKRSFMNLAKPPYKFDYEPIRGDVKKEWILISGFLQRCDHFSSWCEKEGEELNKVEIEPPKIEKIKESIANLEVGNMKIGHDAWQFQEVRNRIDKNIILIAPTGYGKTEFAFLWTDGEKFLYTLPLRSAVNQIHKRAEKILGEGKVGLLHSDADVQLLEKSKDEVETMKIYDFARQLSYPAIISTGDQFFPYGLRPPGYEKVFATLSYSRLVIDEVQAYDPTACAIITKFIEWTDKMGGKFLLMTATLPEFVKNTIEKKLVSGYEIVNIYEKEKNKFQKIFKHKVRVELIDNKKENKIHVFEIPQDIIEKIIKKARDGNRVLVVLNSVAFSQKVYEKLKNKVNGTPLEGQIYLLHSRFTLNDRKEKEKEYIEGKFKNPKPLEEKEFKILVATQIVEASLDIDADVIFTEICPLDALIQRIGRVLRRYFYVNGKVFNKSNNEIFDITQEEFKAFKMISNNEPNVYVWVFKEGLQSGGDNVYSKELIRLSLLWLWKKQQEGELEDLLKEISEINKTEDETKLKELLEREFSSLLETLRKGKGSQEIYNTLISGNGWLGNVDNLEIEISEYDKYVLVNLFYSTLKKDGEYLKKFYDTLTLLDAGWMSERKSEAQEMFREIYDVQVIPSNSKMLDKFIYEVEKFIEEVVSSEKVSEASKFLYSRFKKEILSNYIISLPANRLYSFTPLYEKVSKIKIEDEKLRKRLEKWLSGIYIGYGEYDKEVGFCEEKEGEE